MGNIVLLDDGRIQLCVERVIDERIETRVLVGGTLSSRKGINVLGGGLSAPALTDKDKADILTARLLEADYIAVSFPRSAADLEEARALIRASGSRAAIVAKVERAEVVASVAAMDELIHAADLIMVARGDLGVEIGDARLPGVQKRLIRRCRALGRPVITATQMMESMIASPMPTRAEVMDVANAVMDGSDAVMLSAESATGHYPVEAVAAMARIALAAEQEMEPAGHGLAASHGSWPGWPDALPDEAFQVQLVEHAALVLPCKALIGPAETVGQPQRGARLVTTAGHIQTAVSLAVEQPIFLPLPLPALILTLGHGQLTHPFGHQATLVKLQGTGIPAELLAGSLVARLGDQLIVVIEGHAESSIGYQRRGGGTLHGGSPHQDLVGFGFV